MTVTDEEFVSLAPERSRTIELEEFVDLAEIDPVFYEKSYHVAPVRRMGGEKPYVLLLEALRSAGMVGIGRFVLRTKPHLVAIRPLEKTPRARDALLRRRGAKPRGVRRPTS